MLRRVPAVQEDKQLVKVSVVRTISQHPDEVTFRIKGRLR